VTVDVTFDVEVALLVTAGFMRCVVMMVGRFVLSLKYNRRLQKLLWNELVVLPDLLRGCQTCDDGVKVMNVGLELVGEEGREMR